MHTLSEMLGPDVVCVSTDRDLDDAALFPEEEPHVSRAVETRRREFTTGRWCARSALAELGLDPVPIPAGSRGEPVWPEGIVGSITHCQGFRAAAVARSTALTSLGIDAEPHEPLPDGILEAVARSAERRRLRHLPDVHGDRVLFCAKEAAFKAWYPHGRRILDFDEADVAVDGDGSFACHFLCDVPSLPHTGPLRNLMGRWSVVDGRVVTAVTIPAPART